MSTTKKAAAKKTAGKKTAAKKTSAKKVTLKKTPGATGAKKSPHGKPLAPLAPKDARESGTKTKGMKKYITISTRWLAYAGGDIEFIAKNTHKTSTLKVKFCLSGRTSDNPFFQHEYYLDILPDDEVQIGITDNSFIAKAPAKCMMAQFAVVDAW